MLMTRVFFVKDINSTKEFSSNLKLYSNVSVLYLNSVKCGFAGFGVLKNVNVALSGIKSVNLMEYSIKILRVHIPYNKKLEYNINFQVAIKSITSVFKVSRMRNLSLVG